MNERKWIHGLPALFIAMMPASSRAHDTWVQVSANTVRPDDVVHVDLFLGNHGNDHRDFKIAGKVGSLDEVKLEVIGPDGRKTDLVPDMVDLGYAPKEGFWSGRFVPAAAGLHCASHFRQGIRHGSMGLKGGKTFFLVAESLDKPAKPPAPPPAPLPGPLGHPLEFVLETHPVIGCGPGKPITVQLLFKGKPLADHVVSFIPRGATLAAGFDPEFERKTDAEGRCSYTPKEGNFVLVVTHHVKPEEQGEGYEKTAYAATLVLNVPERCACCEE
ncbi:MAG: DUF4198 domain-containing protein [Planctomycetia bacterium]|jgi:uncharacterized GH25 family protein